MTERSGWSGVATEQVGRGGAVGAAEELIELGGREQIEVAPAGADGKPLLEGPARAAKMGSIAVDKVIAKLGTPAEFYAQLEPDSIAEHIVNVFRPDLPALVDDVMMREHPRLWRDLPRPVRQAVIDRVRVESPAEKAGLKEGDVVVVKAGDSFEVLATNTLADQSFIASPVIVDGDIYLRSQTHLFRIGEP